MYKKYENPVTREEILEFYEIMEWENIPKKCSCIGGQIKGPCAWWLSDDEVEAYFISAEDKKIREQVKTYLGLIKRNHTFGLETLFGK